MNESATHHNTPSSPIPDAPLSITMIRSVIGGMFMGLANLVPGISGGTMLLAVGIYPAFVNAIAEVTRLKPTRRSLLILGVVVLTAFVSIAAFAGIMTYLVLEYRWAMYSLFIGLTLGGVPIVWRLIGKPAASVWLAAAAGFVGMAALGYLQMSGTGGGGGNAGFVFLFLAGIAGASAMILPGVSGAYLLLVMGVYLTITSSIKEFVSAAKDMDIAAMMPLATGVILPVGIGVIVGVVGVSNLIKWLLERFEKPTLGVLLGLLVGAVVGLYPFQQAVLPEPGSLIKGRPVEILVRGQAMPGEAFENPIVVMYADTGNEVELVEEKDYPTAVFTPSVLQIGLSLLLVAAGFAVTLGVAQLDRKKQQVKEQTQGQSSRDHQHIGDGG